MPASAENNLVANLRTQMLEKQMRILVIEDDPDTLLVMRKLLAGDGHEVATADGCETARQTCQKQLFDLVLCDIGLKDGDGCDLLRELRQQHRLNGIAISGYGLKEDLQRSREAGFLGHLVKPVTMEQLRLAIQKAVTSPRDRACDPGNN